MRNSCLDRTLAVALGAVVVAIALEQVLQSVLQYAEEETVLLDQTIFVPLDPR
jgi:hypothetical protein